MDISDNIRIVILLLKKQIEFPSIDHLIIGRSEVEHVGNAEALLILFLGLA